VLYFCSNNLQTKKLDNFFSWIELKDEDVSVDEQISVNERDECGWRRWMWEDRCEESYIEKSETGKLSLLIG